jgi:glycosyltransferase involved in cell wall biosynthesis
MSPNCQGLPRISIVVPSYNQARFLPDALDSIFCQDYPAAEVIVMDGGSSDDSLHIIRAHSGRLAHWESGPDGGQAAAINAGMRHATGEVVAWLNSDDFYHGDCLWTVADAYLRHPSHGLYIGNGLRYADAARRYSPFCRHHLALNRRALAHGLDYVLQPATFFWKEAWDKVGGVDAGLRFGMDWDVIIRIARLYPVALINEFLAASREYQDTKTKSGGLERITELCALVGRHTGRELTPGTVAYLFDTLMGLSAGTEVEDLRDTFALVLHQLERRWEVELGNHDGFPAYGDPQDHVYLPLPGEVRVRKPAAVAEGLPRISVVCTGEDEALLRAAVQSVLWQGYPGVEAVVAADPSRDLPAGADHVRRWQPHVAQSTSAMINEGFTISRGDVLGWLCTGDLLSDAALWEIGAAFAADPDLDVVCANALCLDDANRPRVVRCGNARTAFAFGQTGPAAELAQHWANAHMLPQPAIFCRRRLLERVGALNPSYEHVFDLEFWWRVARTGTARKIQKTLLLCRLPEQAALRDEQGRRTEWRRLRRSLGLEAAQAHRPWPRVLGGYVLRGLRSRLGSRHWRAAG